MLADPWVEFIGEIDDEQKTDFLGNALALLFPIDWPEPFGLVMIEAMACGTPVIAWDCGAVREVVDPGLTGEIVRTEEQALSVIDRVAALDRWKIRQTFDRRFSAVVMAEKYVSLYRQLAEANNAFSDVIRIGDKKRYAGANAVYAKSAER